MLAADTDMVMKLQEHFHIISKKDNRIYKFSAEQNLFLITLIIKEGVRKGVLLETSNYSLCQFQNFSPGKSHKTIPQTK